MSIVELYGAVRWGRLALLSAAALLAAFVLVGASTAASGRAKGLDVSNWNGAIKWGKVAGAGYRFVFGKATEGTTFVDGTYSTNRSGAEAAGLVFGGYHFARPAGTSLAAATASAIAQAEHFLSVADPQPGELPPVLDLEKTGNLPAKLLRAWTEAWVAEISARLGVQPFVYSSPAFWQEHLGNSPAVAAAGALLWIAHWTSASAPWVPAQNWNGHGWTFWQWTDCQVVPGLAHCSDGDRMNGTSPTSVAIEPYSTDVPSLSAPPSILGPPEAGKLLAVVPGVWNGGKPLAFTYQWKQCDAAADNCVDIPGATGETYRPTSNDVGHSLRVLVTATAPSGVANAYPPPTVAISPAGTPPGQRPVNVGLPVISGTTQIGHVLTSSAGAWEGSPTTFAFQWQRCDSAGANCVALAKATHSSYTLTPDDLGATLAVVVTASGAGGAASAHAVKSAIVALAPLPPVSIGSQVVAQGIAGNVETVDGRATATWQPGAVPVGLTVNLLNLDNPLGVTGSGVALTVPGLPASGFKWPVDLDVTTPLPLHTVLGYSAGSKVFDPVRVLSQPELPTGTKVGSYVGIDATTHVLTKIPLDFSLFVAGAWGDPTYTSPTGPDLTEQAPLRVVVHSSDKTVLILTRLVAKSQTRLTATITAPGGKTLAILPKGSQLGSPLAPSPAEHSVQAERDRPGSIPVRLRLNARRLAAGRYTLRVIAADPWGRVSRLKLTFALPA